MTAVEPLTRHRPPARPAARTMAYQVVVANEAGLHDHLAGWEDLARCAAEPNVFYEPWALLPAVRAFGGAGLMFVLVYHQQEGRAPLLCGFFPLQVGRLHRLLPVRVLRLW